MSQSPDNLSCRQRPRRAFVLWLVILSGLALSCNLLAGSRALPATQTAVAGQQAQLVATITALSALIEPAGAAPVPTQPPGEPPIDPTALQATAAALATWQTTLVPAQPAATQMPVPGVDAPVDERLLKSARILLFEDMSASRYVRLIKKALDEAGYFYLDVGSAKGWFKTQLHASEDWDLIIASAEAEREFGGEFYEYIDTRLQGGAAAIIENWDLDAAPHGRARPLLERCGVAVQADWYLPEIPVFFWTDPNLPLLNQPNILSGGLRNARSIWRGASGDLGDLMMLQPGGLGDAQILAVTTAAAKNDHGVVAVCLGGRMILQTFRSHEYHADDMVALWQNYIYHALKSRFAAVNKVLPTPAVAAAVLSPQPPATSPGPTPGPDYTYPKACGPGLTARVLQAPVLTPDLFEHHAAGVFIVLRLELKNEGPVPVQIWDGDYSLESMLGQTKLVALPNPAATGYLYLESPGRLYQDLIQPGETWRTAVAFDIHPESRGWLLVLRPGSEFDEQVCEVRIPLTR